MKNNLSSPLPPPLDANAAFVVHLTSDGTDANAVSGRVEHVTSGRSLRFTSTTQLVDFMHRLAGGLGKTGRGALGLVAVIWATYVGILGGSSAWAASPCGSTGIQTGSHCSYRTEGSDTFTVPPYQIAVTFEAIGAGDSYLTTGKGGEAKGTLAVTPGTVYNINVGGMPRRGDGPCDIGGVNGGANSGGLESCGGAGASDVRTSAGGLGDRLIVGGGGGGQAAGNGGDGGGESGGDGESSGGAKGDGGGGGSQVAAGASPGTASSAGFGHGGDGGPRLNFGGSAVPGGAGGGGGWYGGGGTSAASLPGGGGGGSGYVTPLATDTQLIKGVGVGGRGLVTASWSATPLAASVTLTSDVPNPIPSGTLVTLTAKVTISTGAIAAGSVILTDYSKGNGAANPSAPADCPCSTVGQGFLDANGEFSVRVNASSIPGGLSHDIVVTFQDSYGAIADAKSTGFVLQVDRTPQTISFTSTAPTNATAFGPTYTVSASATSGLPVSFSIPAAASSVCSISGSTVSFLTAGTCLIDADQDGNASFNAAPTVEQAVTVAAGHTQTIHFTSTPSSIPVPLDVDSYQAAAVGGGSGNPVVFSAGLGGTCIVSPTGLVRFPSGGTCQILANQAGGNGFDAAPQAEQDFDVAPRAQTVIFLSTPPTNPQVSDTYRVSAYSTANYTVALSLDPSSTGCTLTNVSSGFVPGHFATSGTVTFTGNGTCIVDGNQAGDVFTILAAPQVQQIIQIGATPTPTDTATETPTFSPSETKTPTTSETPTPTPTSPPLQPMACYRAAAPQQSFDALAVNLVDALGTVHGTATDLGWLCRPASVNGTNPAATTAPGGLDGYRLAVRSRHATRQTVSDAFGIHTLAISRPDRLMVPGAHSLGSPPATTASALDHFACYDAFEVDRASRKGPRQTVALEDLFGASTPTVGRPTRLCLPTDVSGASPQAPTHADALLCYRLSPTRRARIGRVFVTDDFGTATLVPISRQELCVPATRQ